MSLQRVFFSREFSCLSWADALKSMLEYLVEKVSSLLEVDVGQSWLQLFVPDLKAPLWSFNLCWDVSV